MKNITISQAEHQETIDSASAAREILNDERFQFVINYFQDAINYANTSIMTNSIREVQEVIPFTEKLTRIFKIPKKVQVDELIGQYKLATKFLADLQQYIQIEKDLELAIEKKSVIVKDKEK